MFLMNCWYVAAWDHELIDGKLLARTILEKPVLIYRGDSGRVAALDNRCCHRGAWLSNGRREGDDIRCMYHGLKFDPSGKCIQIPGQDNIPPKLGVLTIVAEAYRGRHIGSTLVNQLAMAGAERGFATLCAFTHAPSHFIRHGFSMVPHPWLPEKIAHDCYGWPKFPTGGP